MNYDTITHLLPLMIGVSLILMGLLYMALPAPSVVKLDRGLEQWVQTAPNPMERAELVVTASKSLGAFITLSGLVYTVLLLMNSVII